MDQKLKTVLAVAIGVVIGMTLLGTAVAIPAVFRAVGHRAAAVENGYPMMGQNADEFGAQGMMGQRGMMRDQGRGMMDRRGQGPSVNGERVSPNGEFGLQQDGTTVCPNGGSGPQQGTTVCPNGGTCPNATTPQTLPQS